MLGRRLNDGGAREVLWFSDRSGLNPSPGGKHGKVLHLGFGEGRLSIDSVGKTLQTKFASKLVRIRLGLVHD